MKLIFIFLKNLFRTGFYAAIQVKGLFVFHPAALDHKKLFVETDILPVHRIEIGTAHAQVVYGIQHIRLSRPVFPYNAIYATFKLEFSFGMIPEID